METMKPILSNDGCLILPKGTSKEGLAKWEHTIVGYFVDRRLSFKLVKQCSHVLWDRKGMKK